MREVSQVNQKLFFLMPVLLLMISCNPTVLPSFRPTELQVARISKLPDNHFPPFSRKITQAVSVQRLYMAALALPHPSGGVINCPNDAGLDYQLRFQSGKQTRQMDMDPGGCASINVANNDRRVATPAFLTLFAQTVGIPRSQLWPEPD
jgi:hypothetical protein